MKNPIWCLAVLTVLSACASKPVVLPLRPAATSTEAATCLRQCESSYVTCTTPASASGRTPIASTSGGILLAAIADNSARSDTQRVCADILKYCYSDCEKFK